MTPTCLTRRDASGCNKSREGKLTLTLVYKKGDVSCDARQRMAYVVMMDQVQGMRDIAGVGDARHDSASAESGSRATRPNHHECSSAGRHYFNLTRLGPLGIIGASTM